MYLRISKKKTCIDGLWLVQFPSAGAGMRHPSMASSSRLLSVPSQHSESRQMSTESLPEYFHR